MADQMKGPPWVIRYYRLAHNLLIGWLIVLALLGLYNAVVITHQAHLVFKRIAILIFYFALLAGGLMGPGLFRASWKVGLIVSLLAVAGFIRYQVFPFQYDRSGSKKAVTRERFDRFKSTNSIGNGYQVGEWDNNRPIWYMTMGDAEILPLLFSLGLPLTLMVSIIVLRRNEAIPS
jgi:hypothetical protein